MSGVAEVRAALESGLAAMSPALATAYENVAFTPAAGTPYQRAYLLPARPDNAEISANYVERGIFQVTLSYPPGAGPAASDARAEAIRQTFKRGASFAFCGVTVLVTDTPEIGSAAIDPDTARYETPVRIRWMAQIAVA